MLRGNGIAMVMKNIVAAMKIAIFSNSLDAEPNFLPMNCEMKRQVKTSRIAKERKWYEWRYLD